MLNNLKKLINAEAESDLQVDLMLEAVNDSIANMFIEEDGEIEMNENVIEINDEQRMKIATNENNQQIENRKKKIDNNQM